MNATNMISSVILRNWQSKEKHGTVCKLATKPLIHLTTEVYKLNNHSKNNIARNK